MGDLCIDLNDYRSGEENLCSSRMVTKPELVTDDVKNIDLLTFCDCKTGVIKESFIARRGGFAFLLEGFMAMLVFDLQLCTGFFSVSALLDEQHRS